MQILLNNAYEAWKSAIYYHDRIEKGFTTLEFQKGFVSSLHNSVELFLKQIMLDNKDHDVATLRNVKEEDDVLLQLKYIRADDLNQFFLGALLSNLINSFLSNIVNCSKEQICFYLLKILPKVLLRIHLKR